MFQMGMRSSEADGLGQDETPGITLERRPAVLHEGIAITGDRTSDGIVDFDGAIIGDLAADTLIIIEGNRYKCNARACNVMPEGP